jgi:hypothetical protein
VHSTNGKPVKARHFAWPIKELEKWNFETLKKCQNPEISSQNYKIFRILPLFQICKVPLVSNLTGHEKCRHFCRLGTLTQNPHCYRWKKPQHLTWPVTVSLLKSGILKIRKKCQNPETLRL